MSIIIKRPRPACSFIRSGIVIKIFDAARGGRCERCDLDHRPPHTACENCGDSISPSRTFVVSIFGRDAFNVPNLAEARPAAEAFIDASIDELRSKIASLTEGSSSDAQDAPPTGGNRPTVDADEGIDLSQFEKEISSLGWPERFSAFIRTVGEG